MLVMFFDASVAFIAMLWCRRLDLAAVLAVLIIEICILLSRTTVSGIRIRIIIERKSSLGYWWSYRSSIRSISLCQNLIFLLLYIHLLKLHQIIDALPRLLLGQIAIRNDPWLFKTSFKVIINCDSHDN